mmetsp:Transcript_75150/g.212555  ORF Transcript_75150/g.212555 Transcript_75150/m.212555 type:complete len:204 (-) Transcript_75150:42-653(-)
MLQAWLVLLAGWLASKRASSLPRIAACGSRPRTALERAPLLCLGVFFGWSPCSNAGCGRSTCLSRPAGGFKKPVCVQTLRGQQPIAAFAGGRLPRIHRCSRASVSSWSTQQAPGRDATAGIPTKLCRLQVRRCQKYGFIIRRFRVRAGVVSSWGAGSGGAAPRFLVIVASRMFTGRACAGQHLKLKWNLPAGRTRHRRAWGKH